MFLNEALTHNYGPGTNTFHKYGKKTITEGTAVFLNFSQFKVYKYFFQNFC